MGLRWTIGIVTALVAAMWVALAVLGDGFRRSFGASENAPWMFFAPIVVGALVIASVMSPERRTLLHVVAVLMVALCLGSLWLARETMFVATMGVLYTGMWLTYYWRTVRA